MAEEIARALQCAICQKSYPPETSGKCPDDDGELVADPLIGSIFAEKYEILSLLGEGGMSKVYKARHTLMNRVVAIKLLHDSNKDTIAKSRFQQEAEAASALSHPNVVTVHDFGLTPNGQAFFIMDCLEGRSLSEILEKKRHLRVPQAVEIFTQACEGLDHAHRKGIIHRDVKPSNLIIMKQEDGTDIVKLVDFGIAKVITPGEKIKQKRITQTGEVFGTPAYMSPEQCNGRLLDARSDLYSFGCLMYESFAGEPPLFGDTFVATVMKHVNDIPAPLCEKALLTVPKPLEQVIMKCLEKDPDNRYGSAAELKQALYDAAFVAGLKGLRVGAVPEPRAMGVSGGGAAPTISVAGENTKRMQQRNIINYSLVASFVMLAVGGWFVFLYPGPEGDPGSLYDKLKWQSQFSNAESLMRSQKYSEAIAALESCAADAKEFNDDNRRLEQSLTKLIDAYAGNHNAEKIEEVNKQLLKLADQKVYSEYDALMKRLKSWVQPTTSSVQWEDRAQQAVAFGERISRCADKLTGRSDEKQEALLKRAAKAFDALNLKEGIYRSMFRLQLAEICRSQQRFDDQRHYLEEALAHSAADPQTPVGWRAKIKTNLLIGELHSGNGNLPKAKQELDHALEWTRTHLASDHELLRNCLNASSSLYAQYQTKDEQTKADKYKQEAMSIGQMEDKDSSDR